jgi:O-antigen ligase
MRKLTSRLLWLFVFTVPWDVVKLAMVGSISRAAGLAVIAAAAVTTAAEARFRRPGAILWLAIAFAVSSALSLLWTVSYESTLSRVLTYAQLVGSVWILHEFVRTEEQRQSLLAAFCLGAFIPVLLLLNNFRTGAASEKLVDRFTADGFNADDVGLMLVIGIPIAWHLMLRSSGAVRMMALTYFGLAPIAVLLTGTRGAFLAGVVALSIVPLTLSRPSLRSFFLVTVLLVVVGAAVAVVVPGYIWDRMATIGPEIQGGQMTGRLEIWKAAVDVFPERPLLGVGAGAFGPAVEPVLHTLSWSHNTPLGLLVEHGVVGFGIFVALLGACAVAILRMRPPDRTFWAVLMLSWLVGIMSLNWEWRKATWLLFGLLAAQGAIETTSRQIARARRERVDADTFARAPVLLPARSRAVAQRASSR